MSVNARDRSDDGFFVDGFVSRCMSLGRGREEELRLFGNLIGNPSIAINKTGARYSPTTAWFNFDIVPTLFVLVDAHTHNITSPE